MALVVAVPEPCFHLIGGVFKAGISDVLEFEDLVIFLSKPAGTIANLRDNGIAFNAIGFNNRSSTKHMWTRHNSYDATGIQLAKPWSVDSDIAGVTLHKMINSIYSVDLETWPETTLAQFAFVASGPSFCPNQLEYGKRNRLRAMLLD